VARVLLLACISFGTAYNAIGQHFDVASVKRVGNDLPLGYSGGPGSSDPGRIIYSRVTMLTLLREAFGLKRDQITGPSWIDDASYSIVATLPPTTTQSELRKMHLNLLVERFGLSYHSLDKEDHGYDLRVDAGGPRITAENRDSGGSAGIGSSSDVSWLWHRGVEGGIVHLSFTKASMGALAGALSREITPSTVVDKTSLTGRYTFEIVYENTQSPESDIVAAVRKQLGLRLVGAKLLREHIVIDRLGPVPTAN
jgi:uncharacterized protein (TIGR03435 family)